MKFSELIQDQAVPEWIDQYINYDLLKDIVQSADQYLDECVRNARDRSSSIILNRKPTQETIQLQTQDPYLVAVTHDFWRSLHEQLTKVEGFFQLQYNSYLNEITQLIYINKHQNKIKGDKMAEIHSVMQNSQELYKGIDLLASYSGLNFQGFLKILHRFGKVFDQVNEAQEKFKMMISNLQFPTALLSSLKMEIEDKVAQLMHINVTVARKILIDSTVKRDNLEKRRTKHAGISGFINGISVCILLSFVNVIVWFSRYEQEINDQVSLLFLRANILISLSICLIGLNLVVFEKLKINYIFIFELPAGKVTASYRLILSIGGFLMMYTSFFGVIILSCLMKDRNDLPIFFGEYIHKLSVLMDVSYWCLFLLLPYIAVLVRFIIRVRTDRSKFGRYMFLLFYKLLTPWSHRVAFQLFYSADVLISMPWLIKDVLRVMTLDYIPDYIAVIFMSIPLLMRVIQCVYRYRETREFYPHLLNSFKNASALPGLWLSSNLVTSNKIAFHFFNAFRVFEVSLRLYWDTCEDWSYFSGGTGAQQFKNLRNKWASRIICRRPCLYPMFICYFSFVFNVVARCIFVLFWCFRTSFANSFMYNLLLQVVELFRRFWWSLIRLENQQVTNCENYLATRQIPILFEMHNARDDGRKSIEMAERRSLDMIRRDLEVSTEHNDDKFMHTPILNTDFNFL